jgi:hypothetical protein
VEAVEGGHGGGTRLASDGGCLLCSVREEEESRVGQNAEWVGWLLGRLGQSQEEILFELKIGFLNLQRL